MNRSLRGYYAGFVSRCIAYTIDAVLIALLLVGGVIFINTVQEVLSKQTLINVPILSSSVQFTLSTALITVFIVFYFAFFWSVAGRTPGKAIMDLRVITVYGTALSFPRALVRVGGYAVSTFLVLGYLWVLVDGRRQGWHDKLARTFVVYDWDAYPGERIMAHVRKRQEPQAGS
jgi:uncharacterized RDD family membrane protein YckC